jgi:hypothetical protein
LQPAASREKTITAEVMVLRCEGIDFFPFSRRIVSVVRRDFASDSGTRAIVLLARRFR